ncbi:hypothetical protein [Clostridium beijerinckii]|nr:hypothetical protein [Clostridium beijerinckii]MBA8936468.1 hypothetical protein [Clostridium beijerinckii]NRU41064.1 hypothetical protein [Clostridium beijerinckii]NSA95661.1 hypothetical protein [Clostridium beijerinckii]OOM67056.1 hypothetical protein CLOBI_04080 [Clostridium beijerinckii]OOM70538.1 hypothetical protein CLBEIC_19610 [Clostridium beijerinckii]
MIKNKMDEVLDGQISIFDLVLNEIKEPKKEYAPIAKKRVCTNSQKS